MCLIWTEFVLLCDFTIGILFQLRTMADTELCSPWSQEDPNLVYQGNARIKRNSVTHGRAPKIAASGKW